MRSFPVLLSSAILASCSVAPGPTPAPMRTADSQHQLDLMIGGKVPLRPVSCLPSSRLGGNDMKIIDSSTLAFRYGPEVYVAHTTGCTNLSPNGPYTLLTHQFGPTGLCQGDVAQVVEAGSGIPVGSCMISDVTPFVARRR